MNTKFPSTFTLISYATKREGIYLINVIPRLAKPLAPEVDVPVSKLVGFHSIMTFSKNLKVFHVFKE
jgi:hypothetical protein